MAMRFTDILDGAAWSRNHWKLFAILSLNYALDGVMFSIAPLVAFIIAKAHASLIFALNLIAETAGALVFGLLADRHGRRKMFIVAIIMEGAALVLLFPLYTNVIALAALTSVMTLGIGGEFGPAYSAIAELMPARHRGKVLVLITNFWNIGAAAIAGLSLAFAALYAEALVQVEYLLASALAILLVARTARVILPESPRWLAARNREREAEWVVKRLTGFGGEMSFEAPARSLIGLREAFSRYRFRLSVLTVITVVQYVTYGMMAYYAPYAQGFAFGEEAAPLVVFVANLGASVGAFLLLFIVDRARRLSALLSFIGGSVFSLVVVATHLLGSPPAFYSSLFAALIFSEWAWGVLSVLQSELFPTGVRASVVGFLTSLTGIAGAAIVLSQTLMTAGLFLSIAAGLWLLGLLAAIAWRLWGVESAGRPVEELV